MLFLFETKNWIQDFRIIVVDYLIYVETYPLSHTNSLLQCMRHGLLTLPPIGRNHIFQWKTLRCITWRFFFLRMKRKKFAKSKKCGLFPQSTNISRLPRIQKARIICNWLQIILAFCLRKILFPRWAWVFTDIGELFQLINGRYERKSTIITTNVPLSSWGTVLNSTATAEAILDRLVYHSHVIKLKGKSYRLASVSS